MVPPVLCFIYVVEARKKMLTHPNRNQGPRIEAAYPFNLIKSKPQIIESTVRA
jgi:hypothetical protein